MSIYKRYKNKYQTQLNVSYLFLYRFSVSSHFSGEKNPDESGLRKQGRVESGDFTVVDDVARLSFGPLDRKRRSDDNLGTDANVGLDVFTQLANDQALLIWPELLVLCPELDMHINAIQVPIAIQINFIALRKLFYF